MNASAARSRGPAGGRDRAPLVEVDGVTRYFRRRRSDQLVRAVDDVSF